MNNTDMYQKRIQCVLRHIETHLDAVPPLDELASLAHFSPFHFHRVFKSVVGESVAAYIRRLRLQRAAQRLSYSQERITPIALDAGYESLEAFIRAFQGMFGVSPSRYRKESRSAKLAIYHLNQ